MKKMLFSIIVLLAFFACSGIDDPDADHNLLLSYSYSQDFVKQKLKDPSSAEFAPLGEKLSHIRHLGNWEYQINSYVTASNSFGGKIKTPYSCRLRIDKENDKVSLLDLRME